MPVKTERPRRLNIVSFLFLAAAFAGVYSIIQFGPVYYRRWKAAGVISELTSKYYANRMRGGEGESAITEEIRAELNTRLRDIGIDETTVQASFQKTMQSVHMEVSYRETVRHPLVGKTSVLDFVIEDDAKSNE